MVGTIECAAEKENKLREILVLNSYVPDTDDLPMASDDANTMNSSTGTQLFSYLLCGDQLTVVQV